MADATDPQRNSEGQQQADRRLAPLLAAVQVPVTVRVGRGRLALRTLLEMAPGTVIELDCNLDDPVELVVGGQTVAQGELVAIGDKLGVRIIQILAPEGDQEL